MQSSLTEGAAAEQLPADAQPQKHTKESKQDRKSVV